MTLPRYMTSTAASASKKSEAKTPLRRVESVEAKTPLRRVQSNAPSATKPAIRRVQSSASSISKIPRLETVNLRQLKPLLEQKADPNRAQELAKAWSRPRGILKPTHRSFLPVPATIVENAELSDDDDDDAETVDQIIREEALLVRKLVNGHPSTPRPIGECDESSTPKRRIDNKNQAKFAANLLAAAVDRLELESIIVLTPPVAASRLIILENAQPQIAIDKAAANEFKQPKIEEDRYESMIDTFYETMLAQYIIDTCREAAYEENLTDSKTLLMRAAAAAAPVVVDTPVKQQKAKPPKTPKTTKSAKKPKTPKSPKSPRKTRSKTMAQVEQPLNAMANIKDDEEPEIWICMKNEAVQTVDDL